MAAAVLETGVYYIQNLGSGTVIDLDGGLSVNGTKVQGFEKHELSDYWAPAQLWVISKGSDDTYRIQNASSRTYLDLRSANNATPIVGYAGTGADYQKWVITRAANRTSYVIANKGTGTYVDLAGGSAASGTVVQGYAGSGPSTNVTNQLWLIVRA